VIALGNRLHVFAHPDTRDSMKHFYGTLLGCSVRELDFGLPHPIVLVTSAGGSFSVEFVEDAYDPEKPWRGAWIEFISDNAPALRQRLREAGVPEFRHPGSPHVYFRAPNGQVLRILTEAQTKMP
jgi:catechol 2,3-dioxygenase-like lactoylglutathione lyase family enzyme